MKCTKCGYVRQEKDDLVSADECPACGIIYAKHATAIRSKTLDESFSEGAAEQSTNTMDKASVQTVMEDSRNPAIKRIKLLIKNTIIAFFAFCIFVILFGLMGIDGLAMLLGLSFFIWLIIIRPLKKKRASIAKFGNEKVRHLKRKTGVRKSLAKFEGEHNESSASRSKLMECPDCNKQVSVRAISCPVCGCPIKEVCEKQREIEELPFPPEFPENLLVGPLLFVHPNSFTSTIIEKGSSIRPIFQGEKTVFLHMNGIVIVDSVGSNLYPIHYSQIIDATYSDQTKISPHSLTQSKSMAGRVLGGAILFGPVGAIIGAISATSTGLIHDPHFLTIRFWDWDSTGEPIPHYLVFGDNYTKIKTFQKFADKITMEKQRWVS